LFPRQQRTAPRRERGIFENLLFFAISMSDLPFSLHAADAHEFRVPEQQQCRISVQLTLDFWFSVFAAVFLQGAPFRPVPETASRFQFSGSATLLARNEAHENDWTANPGQIWRRSSLFDARDQLELEPFRFAPDSFTSRSANMEFSVVRPQMRWARPKRGMSESAIGSIRTKFCYLRAKWSRAADWIGLTA